MEAAPAGARIVADEPIDPAPSVSPAVARSSAGAAGRWHMRVIWRRSLVWIARIGFIGRGAVFLILGAIALWAGLTDKTLPVGTSGAMNVIFSQPAGSLLSLVVAVGLLCFAALRVIEAVDDVYGYGDDWHGWMQRGALAAAGLFYTALGLVGASIVLTGRYAESEDAQVRDWTAWALSMPWGTWLVALAGAIMATVGIGLAVAGLRKKFARRIRKMEGSRIVIAFGVVGFLARSVVFVLIGCFLVFAAWHSDPNEALGFGGALRLLRGEPYGQAMLLAAALGLIAFGAFGIAEARYGRAAKPR